MREDSTQWDKQWSTLLTRCHGEDVVANSGFKSRLLKDLQAKAAEVAAESSEEAPHVDDRQWSRLLNAAYTPCYSDVEFKERLIIKLKTRQAEVARATATAEATEVATPAQTSAVPVTSEASTTSTTSENSTHDEDAGLRTILTTTYTPVAPRRDFQTRLLENLKERQRTTLSLIHI